MDSISEVLKNKKLEKGKKPVAHGFQDLALEIITELKAVDTERSSIFKICKSNYSAALRDYKYCKENGKNALYFLWLSNN